MLIKKLRAFSTPKQKKQDIEAFRQEFDNEDFVTFLRKFRGSLIFRGKSSLSYKLLDRIRIRFKKVISIKDEDPEDGLEKAINMLVPVIGTSNVRRGRKVQTVPSFLKLRKRIVLINKWLISSQKNKSNVRGIKIDQIASLLLLAMIGKGSAYNQKMEYVKKAFSLRYLLLRQGRRLNRRAFRNFQLHVLKKLQKKYASKEKEVIITTTDDVKTFISSLKFLKSHYAAKSYRIKKQIKKLRAFLFENWDYSSFEKVFILLDWLVKVGPKKRLQINFQEIDKLKKRYYKEWKKRKS